MSPVCDEDYAQQAGLEYERVHAAAVINEKRGENFERVVGEWEAKVGTVKISTKIHIYIL